ncbi:sigma-54-dependent Fis family transcriptional regulator [Candidatus Poribacteria bacterium]|jgi:two-component system, NtrC family, response regulator HydG|nr:sigma-54-dependent Fis family transcriptional regulator [Candidatus Poribacteria bacterium]MBT5710002.1 sigma-54-dependent Fis family transcriptional regulator [Candidatus Poribacteria bacterium]MBT7096729.1 sigma-54-dependent Fis family transcriptional regulator [Candidatus Poribacteria bacterium]MBT7809121.1 sigma-54-dependent Fis family transcriptional regulator [Candidatus Poribacteria bacterium]
MTDPAEGPTILIVDDDAAEREQTGRIFRGEGYDIVGVAGGVEALRIIESRDVAVLLTDLKMPEMDGQELLRHAKEARPELQVIVVTGFGSVEGAVDAMQAGAGDFLQKPLDIQTARARVRKAVEKHELERQNVTLREQVDSVYGLENMIGSSLAMQEVFRKIRRVAPTNATVLLLGESGTGKELAARAVHNLSPRARARFLPFNCAAVTRELVESELFGYNRGAFTGASRDKPGYFEEANGGTLLLDEIGEMTMDAQAKLLRVLEEREIMRVGGTRAIPIDVRILASTNRELEEAVRDGTFREDLYHRIKVFPIDIPPLRERREDMPVLAEHHLMKAAEEHGVPPKPLGVSAMDAFRRYDWPGNVRELRNLMSFLVLSVEGAVITEADLPDSLRDGSPARPSELVEVGRSMDDIEREAILRTLKATDGNKTKAADMLGIGLRTLYRKLDRYGEDVSDEPTGTNGED